MKEHLSWLQNWLLPLERLETAVVSVPLLSSKVKALTTDLSTSKYSQGFRSVTLCTQTGGWPSFSAPGQIMKSWAGILGHWLLPPGLSVCAHMGLILGKPILPPSLLLVVGTLPLVQVKMTSCHPYRASSVPATVVSSHSILAF